MPFAWTNISRFFSCENKTCTLVYSLTPSPSAALSSAVCVCPFVLSLSDGHLSFPSIAFYHSLLIHVCIFRFSPPTNLLPLIHHLPIHPPDFLHLHSFHHVVNILSIVCSPRFLLSIT